MARSPWFALLLLAACSPAAPPAPPAPPASASPPVPAASSAPPVDDEPIPTGRLPADVRLTRQALTLTLDPDRPRYAGKTRISLALSKPRQTLWLHGKGLAVSAVEALPAGGKPVAARWEQVNEEGVAAVRLASPAPAGELSLVIDFEAAFGDKLKGVFLVTSGGKRYAFTQFQAISARESLPCLDEPAFKAPWDITLLTRPDHEAIANTREVERSTEGPWRKVRFAPTEPIPSEIVAFAVGPLDVVEARPIAANPVRDRPLPLRGVAAQGRGKEMAHALESTREIVALLESYMGVPYPYDKLDMIAVPGKDGAMENPGAVTFRESLLLFDEKKAPINQVRSSAVVIAHELAHQWFGNLVTMPWWNDIWLNEAFATWMGARMAAAYRPDTEAEVSLLESIDWAMTTDSLVSARKIRQEIASTHDIHNAFDGITYQKGGSVIAMFERWMTPQTFRKGLSAYMKRHAMGLATADDLLKALSEAAGKDVAAPFRTFLDQPGVPLVEARLSCQGEAKVALKQSRYLPLGSSGDPKKTWQIPVCIRHGKGKEIGETCALLDQAEGSIKLPQGCPDWYFPNADAAGYYRFAMAEADLKALAERGYPSLNTREKIAFSTSLRAAMAQGATSAEQVLRAQERMASDAHPSVIDKPSGPINAALDWLHGDDALRARIERYGAGLYGPAARGLRWDPAREEAPAKALRRQRVLSFLALSARDPATRAEARRRGEDYVGHKGDKKIHPEKVDTELAGTALTVAAEEGDAALFDALLAHLTATEDDVLRGRLLHALGSFKKPELIERALQLSLDPRLRVTEVTSTLWPLFGSPRTRDAAWAWLRANIDKIEARLPASRSAGLPYLPTYYCSDERAEEVKQFFGPRVGKLDGGPRILDSAHETIKLCAARRARQQPSFAAFFSPPGAARGARPLRRPASAPLPTRRRGAGGEALRRAARSPTLARS